MPYVSRRWLGGLLTNFQTINKRIKRLHELTDLETGGQLALLPTKERMAREAELKKLEFNLGGVRDMERPPDAVFVIDLNAEEIAVNEARRLGIPIVALVDTNCNPRPVEYVIPGNDDAIRSCDLITRTLGEAILESATAWQAAEDARRKREEEERRKREEEQRKKREEEEARKAAEAEEAEAAKNRAEAAAKAEAEGKPDPSAKSGKAAQAKKEAAAAPAPAQAKEPAKPKSPRKIEDDAPAQAEEPAKPKSPRKIEDDAPAEDAKPKSPRKIEDDPPAEEAPAPEAEEKPAEVSK
jgi:small subunit ribosomal protein S2